MVDQVLKYGPWIILGGGLLFFAYSFARYGFRGSMFGGKIRGTFGEIPLSPLNGPSGVLRVHKIVRKGKPHIGIEIVQKTILSYDLTPFTISAADTVALIKLLEQAMQKLSEGMDADVGQGS